MIHNPPAFGMAYRFPNWIIWLTLLLSVSFGSILDQRSLKAINNTHYDYVIAGGGTAGLVVARRLSEDPKITVAVIEAGTFERNNPNVRNTTQFDLTDGTRVDWSYQSTIQVFGNRSLLYHAGKGVGGTSLINGE